MTRKPTEAESDMVAEFLSETILKITDFMAGKFMDRFEVKFQFELRDYELSLKKTHDPFLPEDCQSKEDGVCNLPSGACQQCL